MPAPGNDMAVAPRVTFRFAEFECDAAAYNCAATAAASASRGSRWTFSCCCSSGTGNSSAREDIAHYLWGDDVFVGVDTGIRAAVLKVRRVLAVPQGAARFVETVPGKGYRFVAAVEVITRIAIPDAGGSPPGMPIPSRGRHNLPADLTSLLGREADMKEVRRLLAATRLLSLTGSGGVGRDAARHQSGIGGGTAVPGRHVAGRSGGAHHRGTDSPGDRRVAARSVRALSDLCATG